VSVVIAVASLVSHWLFFALWSYVLWQYSRRLLSVRQLFFR